MGVGGQVGECAQVGGRAGSSKAIGRWLKGQMCRHAKVRTQVGEYK